MRTPQLSALVFAVLTFSAVAAEPQKLWEASGFKQPESVVFDRAAGAIYVSNVNGDPMKKDGNGFISKLGPDGKVVTREGVKGLDRPTGLALANRVRRCIEQGNKPADIRQHNRIVNATLPRHSSTPRKKPGSEHTGSKAFKPSPIF